MPLAAFLRTSPNANRQKARLNELNAELQAQSRELARSNADLEQFAFAASHDLQEPLRMVISHSQLMSKRYKGKLDADADEFINYAVNGAMRMQAMIGIAHLFAFGDGRVRPLD